MKLYNISNAGEFLTRVLDCKGMVYAVESDGRAQDLKELAQYLISSGMAGKIEGIREIDLAVEKPVDRTLLLNYVAGMKLNRKTALNHRYFPA